MRHSARPGDACRYAGIHIAMKTEPRVVDNRVFLLGLDELYRETMKQHERDELLRCAKDTASVLAVAPADVPIEGYYAEEEQLTEYFRLVRALQRVPKLREPEVHSLDTYKRLKQVTASPIFGPPFDGDCLLASGQDSLSVALETTFPEWNIGTIMNTAYRCALDSGEFSLVALGALSRDSVVLAAVRESVVLYAMAVGGCAFIPDPEYIWQVDDIVESRARRFVETFNGLFDECLPEPSRDNAEAYWRAFKEWKIVGRCVRIGFDDSVQPIKHYHWAIDRDAKHKLIVKDFWDMDIWTTQRYRAERESRY
jgi:hypothetical protein